MTNKTKLVQDVNLIKINTIKNKYLKQIEHYAPWKKSEGREPIDKSEIEIIGIFKDAERWTMVLWKRKDRIYKTEVADFVVNGREKGEFIISEAEKEIKSLKDNLPFFYVD